MYIMTKIYIKYI